MYRGNSLPRRLQYQHHKVIICRVYSLVHWPPTGQKHCGLLVLFYQHIASFYISPPAAANMHNLTLQYKHCHILLQHSLYLCHEFLCLHVCAAWTWDTDNSNLHIKNCFTDSPLVKNFALYLLLSSRAQLFEEVHHYLQFSSRVCKFFFAYFTDIFNLLRDPLVRRNKWTSVSAQQESFQTIKAEPEFPRDQYWAGAKTNCFSRFILLRAWGYSCAATGREQMGTCCTFREARLRRNKDVGRLKDGTLDLCETELLSPGDT